MVGCNQSIFFNAPLYQYIHNASQQIIPQIFLISAALHAFLQSCISLVLHLHILIVLLLLLPPTIRWLQALQPTLPSCTASVARKAQVKTVNVSLSHKLHHYLNQYQLLARNS